ncbi:MAG: arginine--tRNA ligase [Vicinamibacteria bacterium]
MILEIQARLADAVRAAARRAFDVGLESVGFQYPPKTELGDLALTAPFDLAKTLRCKPREIAERLSQELRGTPGVARAEVAGGGYVNLYLGRGPFAAELHQALVEKRAPAARPGRVIVEHTSINPNKAAHIGHLRNATLGDTFVRVLRARGHQVGIQNYIDDTGVQVADVVVGFLHLEGKRLPEVEAIGGRFDYYCWDLYAKVGDFYAESPENKKLQVETLHAIEAGGNPTAALGAHVAERILACHLATMERLGIRYDLLAHESDILRLHFWNRAFELLKESGAIRLETAGKSAGCWVLTMGDDADSLPAGRRHDQPPPGEGSPSAAAGPQQRTDRDDARARAATAPPGRDSLPPGRKNDDAPPGEGSPSAAAGPQQRTDRDDARARAATAPPGRDSLPAGRKNDDAPPSEGSPSAAAGGRIDEDKIIVRSNGTVTYTGKDIAYQLWKLGKLDRDFRYRRYRRYEDGHQVWQTTSGAGEPGAPVFGHARAVWNVIDVGQSYPQRVVKAGVAALGHAAEAEASHHLAYEKVVLSPATARALGYEVGESGAVKVSGRKGLGVKADDLLDALIAKAGAEIEARDPERPAEAKRRSAEAIAIGALRYFLLKYGRNKVITFDMDEALAFVGETGPYLQNAVVRARSIFARLGAEGHDVAALLARARRLPLDELLAGDEGDEAWALLMMMARSEDAAEQALRAEDVALLARHAFAVAQAFHSWYQKPQHSLLRAESEDRRAFRALVVDAFVRQMQALAELLGIPVPERM